MDSGPVDEYVNMDFTLTRLEEMIGRRSTPFFLHGKTSRSAKFLIVGSSLRLTSVNSLGIRTSTLKKSSNNQPTKRCRGNAFTTELKLFEWTKLRRISSCGLCSSHRKGPGFLASLTLQVIRKSTNGHILSTWVRSLLGNQNGWKASRVPRPHR